MNKEIIAILKRRIDNLLFNIKVNAKYGEHKMVEDVLRALKSTIVDLKYIGIYRDEVENIIWHIECNVGVLGPSTVLETVSESLRGMSDRIEYFLKNY